MLLLNSNHANITF